MSQSTNPTMFLNATADINTWVELANKAGSGVINPEGFYNKQLLDTIRLDADRMTSVCRYSAYRRQGR